MSVQLPWATSAAMPMLSPKVGVRVDGLADVEFVGAHLDGQRHLADHVARMRADDATAHESCRARVRRGCRRTAAW
jgi:hypothetical protein